MTHLAPVKYKITANGCKARFENGKKQIAEVSCTPKDIASKLSQTTLNIDHDRLTEIQGPGRTKIIEHHPRN